MIKSFGDKETEKIWNGIRSSKLPNEIQNRGTFNTGAIGAMAPVDFEKLCFGTYEIIIKVHFWARFLSNS